MAYLFSGFSWFSLSPWPMSCSKTNSVHSRQILGFYSLFAPFYICWYSVVAYSILSSFDYCSIHDHTMRRRVGYRNSTQLNIFSLFSDQKNKYLRPLSNFAYRAAFDMHTSTSWPHVSGHVQCILVQVVTVGKAP